MWKWARWRRVTVDLLLGHFSTQAVMALGQPVTSVVGQSPSHFWTQADVALCAVRVPRPSGSSFTYRRRAPRRPASARVVGMQRTCIPVSACVVDVRRIGCNAYSGLAVYSVSARQPCRLPLTVGWMLPVGKGGARRAGDTDGSIYRAGSGVHKPLHNHRPQRPLRTKAFA
jgi:hypothetical protein